MKSIEFLKSKLAIDKWYLWIPVIGPMIYSVRFEMNLIEGVDKKMKRSIKFYKSILNGVSMLIGIAFLIALLLVRNKNGWGPVPWFFWIGLGIGLSNNILVIWHKWLYEQGFKRYEKKNSQ